MASEALKAKIAEYDDYVERKGIDKIDEDVFRAYSMAARAAIGTEHDLDYGLVITGKGKAIMERVVQHRSGVSVWELEKYAFENRTYYSLLNSYYDLLLIEAQNYQVDAAFQYLERKRQPKERFYMPRRKQFMRFGLVDAFQGLIDDRYDIVCISMPPGTAKAQPLYSKVLTPDGFKRMGDIRVGDTVIAGNGKETRVVGVFPQGVKPVYELTFDDGSKCRCSDEHLWTVRTLEDRKKGRSRTVELSEMLGNYRRGSNANYSVDYVPRIQFCHRDLPVSPYVLGYLIADGCFARKNIGFATGDLEVAERIRNELPKGYEVVQHARYNYGVKSNQGGGRGHKSDLRAALEALGLFGHYSNDKFIPDLYKYADDGQRIDLLRGLLDADGYVSKAGHAIEYTSISKQLACDVAELVHSLGGYASVSTGTARYKSRDGGHVECGEKYRVVIEFPGSRFNPFFVSRKAIRFRGKQRGQYRFIHDIRYVQDEECQCILIEDPCHLYITDDYIVTHNTTAEKFFHALVAGWYPMDCSLFYSHSSDITRMYYDGVADIIQNKDEYAWNDIFPGLAVTGTNAKLEQLNVGKVKAFPSVQCTSYGSKNAGKVRASKFLLVDDLVGGIEEALNKNILDKLWNAYAVDARQRKIQDTDGRPCKEIHIATRWSVHDVIGRLQRMYDGDPRVKIINVPDIDPVTGESNFDYECGGFTKAFFDDQARLMDPISYQCLYKQEPVEREGLLYHADDIRTYFALPEKEPDAIFGICDTKSKGIDFMFLPVVYQYGGDYYLDDCVCDDNSDFGVQEARCSDLLLRNNVQQCQFESNVGGDRFAANVAKKVDEKGGRCNITTKPTETNKETKIIVNADWVKKHVLFKDKTLYEPHSDYGQMMSQLLSYVVAGRNRNDDVPDGMAMLALYATRDTAVARNSVQAIRNPFSWGGGDYYGEY